MAWPPKVQANLMKCWHAVEQVLGIAGLGPAAKMNQVFRTMQSPGQPEEGSWPHQSSTRCAVYQVLNPGSEQSGLLGIRAVM